MIYCEPNMNRRFDRTRLKLLRQMKNHSIRQFAKEVGVSKMTAANWETGVQVPRATDIDVMAERYGVDPTFFWPEHSEELEPALT